MRWLRHFLPAGGIGLLLGLTTAISGRATDAPAHAHKSYKETIPETSVSFEMIAIPGGQFQMGSPASRPDGREVTWTQWS